MTLRIVPSRGSAIAARARVDPRAAARARTSDVSGRPGSGTSATPWKKCARIAPELPRALSIASAAARRRTSPALAKRGCAHPLQHRAQREGQVGAGVAIRHGKNVDAIDLLALRHDPLDSRDEGPPQSVN